MKRDHVITTLFFLIAAIIFYLSYRIFLPFFVPLCWAVVIVILAYPLYERILRRVKRPSIAALIMCMLIIVLIIGPLTFLGLELISQASDAFNRVGNMLANGELQKLANSQIPGFAELKEKLSPYIDSSNVNLTDIVKGTLGRGSGAIVGHAGSLILDGLQASIYFVIMSFSLFYLFKDGRRIVAFLERLMPLGPTRTISTFSHLRNVINATMYSGAVVALLQGLIGGVLFWIFGIPSPVFWGAIMAFMSVLPFVGSAVIYVPAGLILMFGGIPTKGLILIIVSCLTITQVDHFVRPLLVSGKTSIHPLILFYSIAGGIVFFGLLGIVMGPLVAAVFLTLLEIIDHRLNPEDESALSVLDEVSQ